MEFARDFWKNKAFRQMTFGLYCPPMAFCEQAKVRNNLQEMKALFFLFLCFGSDTIEGRGGGDHRLMCEMISI